MAGGSRINVSEQIKDGIIPGTKLAPNVISNAPLPFSMGFTHVIPGVSGVLGAYVDITPPTLDYILPTNLVLEADAGGAIAVGESIQGNIQITDEDGNITNHDYGVWGNTQDSLRFDAISGVTDNMTNYLTVLPLVLTNGKKIAKISVAAKSSAVATVAELGFVFAGFEY